VGVDNLPNKIISGGQTGADQGGLEAGKILGIVTGGTAPPGFITEDGPQPLLLKRYGLMEGVPDPRTYPKRTIKNVADSDGTVWFGNSGSPGGRLTLGTCRSLGKPVLINPTSEVLSKWVEEFKISVLNVAGNRERTNPGITDWTIKTIVEAFS
jgi:hypothetical protein